MGEGLPASRRCADFESIMIFYHDHNSIMKDIRRELGGTNDFDEADVIFLWNDVNPIERSIVSYACRQGKKTFVIQHGRKGSSKYYPPFNEPIHADKMLVWGEFDKNRLIKAGKDPKSIEVVGTTIFNKLIPRIPHKGINVVFCPEHWDRPVEENIKVRDELRKLKGVNIITKIIESHNPEDFDNPIQTNRDEEGHLEKCIEVLATADIVVGVSESTFELLAQAMDIPVVIMEEWEPKAFGGDLAYTTYERLISRASHKTTVKNLNKTIKEVLKNPHTLKKERAEVVEEEGGRSLDTIRLIKELL